MIDAKIDCNNKLEESFRYGVCIMFLDKPDVAFTTLEDAVSFANTNELLSIMKYEQGEWKII